ncbi:hypothetical protein SAMN05443247_06375 [Bradyrhizobium erythrophlei]|jgi:hypothetical protein|nr:hypothetical protein SAMN05443247_06375 [Bradyrhizobium erythrophlei]
MEALILVATLGGPTMYARIGIMRALNECGGYVPPHSFFLEYRARRLVLGYFLTANTQTPPPWGTLFSRPMLLVVGASWMSM